MTDFSKTELRRLDLTLLLVLLGLIRLRKASEVATDLGLTPSGVSQALKRLRDIFGDPLFLRRPHGLEPTAVALALEMPVASAVEALRGALGLAQRFEPLSANGVVRIAALDSEQALLIPPLTAELRRLAPGLTLSVLPLARQAAIAALVEGQADLSLGFIWNRPAAIGGEALYTEGFLVAGRPAALPQAPGITLQDYAAAEHILVSPGGGLRGVADSALSAAGLQRRVVLTVPAFLPGLVAAARTGALVTLPARLARAFAPGFGLVTARAPLDLRRFAVSVYWHPRNDRNPALIWLRARLADIARAGEEADI